MLKNFKLKIREEEVRIEVEELSELELALEEVIEKEKAANAQLESWGISEKEWIARQGKCRRNAPSNYGNLGESKKRREASGLTTGDQKKGRQDVVDQTPLTLWEKNGKSHDIQARGNGTKTVDQSSKKCWNNRTMYCNRCNFKRLLSMTADARHVIGIHATKWTAKPNYVGHCKKVY